MAEAAKFDLNDDGVVVIVGTGAGGGVLANELAQKLQEIGSHGHFSERRNKNGSIGLKKVNERLKEIDSGDEFDVLTNYVTTDKEQKAVAKKAKQMLDAAETGIVKRLAEKPLPDGYGELAAVDRYLQLLEEKSKLKSEKEDGEKAIDQLAHDKYPDLSIDEIKSLVVDDKWLSLLQASIDNELEVISQRLTGRVRQVASRYETPLPRLGEKVAEYAELVDGHLVSMGAICN